MPHLDEGVLHSLVDGEIGTPEIEVLERHLAECTECRSRLDEARQLRAEAFGILEQLDEAPLVLGAPAIPMFQQRPDVVFVAGARRPWEPVPAASPPRRRRWRWMAPLGLAAAAILAVVIRTRTPEAPTPSRAPEEEPLARLVPPTASLATPPAGTAGSSRSDRPLPRSTEAPRTTAPTALPAVTRPDPKATRGTAAGALIRADSPVATTGSAAAAADAQAAPPTPRRKIEEPALKLDEMVASSPKPAPLTARTEALGKAARNLAKPLQEAPAAVSAETAIKTLGGSIRLVDGLAPERYELDGIVVRVVYRTAWGPLALEQWRAGNVLAHRLLAAPGTPDDSVAAWKERIR